LQIPTPLRPDLTVAEVADLETARLIKQATAHTAASEKALRAEAREVVKGVEVALGLREAPKEGK